MEVCAVVTSHNVETEKMEIDPIVQIRRDLFVYFRDKTQYHK